MKSNTGHCSSTAAEIWNNSLALTFNLSDPWPLPLGQSVWPMDSDSLLPLSISSPVLWSRLLPSSGYLWTDPEFGGSGPWCRKWSTRTGCHGNDPVDRCVVWFRASPEEQRCRWLKSDWLGERVWRCSRWGLFTAALLSTARGRRPSSAQVRFGRGLYL